MANLLKLRVYKTVIDGVIWRRIRSWNKSARNIYDVDVDTNSDEVLPLYERWNGDAFTDQWVDEFDVQQVAWSNTENAYLYSLIQGDEEIPNLVTAGWFNIEIQEPLVKGSSSGSDGYFKFRAATSESDTYEYKLTPPTGPDLINQTGIFTGLSVGTHLLTVIDPTDPNSNRHNIIFEQPYEVEATVEYGTRFRANFVSEIGESVTLDLKRKHYTGDIEEICLAGNPISITTDIIGDDFASGIVPMDIAISMLKDYDAQYDELFATEESYWLAQLTIGSSLDITGALMIGNSNIQHLDNPVVVEINMVAGLSNMGEEAISGWSGMMSLADALAAIQNQFNTAQYEIRDFIGLREYQDPQQYAWETMRRYGFDVALFNGKTPKEAAELLIKAFGCSLTHSNDNMMHIQRTAVSTKINQTLQGSIYDKFGDWSQYTSIDIEPLEIKCDGTGDAGYRDSAQVYGYLPKVGKYVISNDFAEVVELKWQFDDLTKYYFTSSAYGLSMEGDFGRLGGQVETKVLKHFKHRSKVTSGAVWLRGTGMRVIVSATTRLMADDVTDELDVVGKQIGMLMMYGTNRSANTEGSVDNNLGTIKRWNPRTVNVWGTESIDSTMILSGGELPLQKNYIKVWLYGIWNHADETGNTVLPQYTDFKDVTIKVKLPKDHADYNDSLFVDLDNDGQDIGNITTELGDAPYHEGYGTETGGVLVKMNHSITQFWLEYDTGSGVKLKNVLSRDITTLRQKNIKKLEGVVQTAYPASGMVLYDPTLDGGFFMPQRFTYDVKFNKLGFSALEITADTGRRLLEETPWGRNTENLDKRTLQ